MKLACGEIYIYYIEQCKGAYTASPAVARRGGGGHMMQLVELVMERLALVHAEAVRLARLELPNLKPNLSRHKGG
jgi:hypothetical protein